MAEIKVEKTIYELLQEVRYELSKTSLKKSGRNTHLNFDYFELADFVPTVTKLFNDRGICPVFQIVTDPNGIEVAVLQLIKGSESIRFQVPTAETSNMSGIQGLGAKITYLRRYLYLIALDITENDIVDASLDADSNKATGAAKATKKQISLIKELYDVENIAKMLQYYNIEKIEDISMKDASAVIARKANK